MATTAARIIAYYEELKASAIPDDTIACLVADANRIEVTDRGLRVNTDQAAGPHASSTSRGPLTVRDMIDGT